MKKARKIIREELLKEANSQWKKGIDSEYIQRILRINAEDFEDSDDQEEASYAIAYDFLADRFNQHFPGNVDITDADLKDIIEEPQFKKLLKRLKISTKDFYEDVSSWS